MGSGTHHSLTIRVPHFGQVRSVQGCPATWGSLCPHAGHTHLPPGPAACGPPLRPRPPPPALPPRVISPDISLSPPLFRLFSGVTHPLPCRARYRRPGCPPPEPPSPVLIVFPLPDPRSCGVAAIPSRMRGRISCPAKRSAPASAGMMRCVQGTGAGRAGNTSIAADKACGSCGSATATGASVLLKAPSGHAEMQAPQQRHSAWSTTACPPSMRSAPAEHTAIHCPQPVHRSRLISIIAPVHPSQPTILYPAWI